MTPLTSETTLGHSGSKDPQTPPAHLQSPHGLLPGPPSEAENSGVPCRPRWVAEGQPSVRSLSEQDCTGFPWYETRQGGNGVQAPCPHHPVCWHRSAKSLRPLDLNLTLSVVWRYTFQSRRIENVLYFVGLMHNLNNLNIRCKAHADSCRGRPGSQWKFVTIASLFKELAFRSVHFLWHIVFSKSQTPTLYYSLLSTLGSICWFFPCFLIWALKSLIFSLFDFVHLRLCNYLQAQVFP